MSSTGLLRRQYDEMVSENAILQAALAVERARADELQESAHWLTNERERLQLELQDAQQERDASKKLGAYTALKFTQQLELNADLKQQQDAAVAALWTMTDAAEKAVTHLLEKDAAGNQASNEADILNIATRLALVVMESRAILQAADQRVGEGRA